MTVLQRQLFVLLSFSLLLTVAGCKKEEPSLVKPAVITGEATNITAHAGTIAFELTGMGDSPVSEAGVVVSESPLPVLSDSGWRGTVTSPDSTGRYEVAVEGLYSYTTYYYRAYAINKAGVAYGEAMTFQTDITIPEEINFRLLTVIKGYNFTQAIGFAGSAGLQSLFLVNRQIDPEDRIQYERIFRFDILTGSTDSLYNPIVDYISKEVQIINGRPYAIGSEYMSVYEFDFEESPAVSKHGRKLTRHGSAQRDGRIYIWGGDRLRLDSDKIWEYNFGNRQFEYVATMPGPKSYAAGEIVNGKLYIFGGQQEFSGTLRENKIYVYDFNSGSFEVFYLPEAPYRTYAAAVGELIFLAGHINPTGEDTTDLMFGVFDTRNNTYTEIPINLSDEAVKSIWAMTAIGNTLYVVYGDPVNDAHEVTGQLTFTIQEARLP